MGTDLVKLYVTCKNREEADALSNYLLEKRLVACANVFPIHSRYWWQGKIQHAEEHALLLTTRKAHLDKVQKEITDKHSYDTPCILSLDVVSNPPYAAWVEAETR